MILNGHDVNPLKTIP